MSAFFFIYNYMSNKSYIYTIIYICMKGNTVMKYEGEVRIPSGCAIAAVISKEGNRMSGQAIYECMKPMHDRSNGLGGGFAGYGIYPEYKDFYAFHMFFDDRDTRKLCEAFLKERFEIVQSEIIPTRKIPSITNEPDIWRYFVAPLKSQMEKMQIDEKEFVARSVKGCAPPHHPGVLVGYLPCAVHEYPSYSSSL